jgi:CheY-like chemotaxis protein
MMKANGVHEVLIVDSDNEVRDCLAFFLYLNGCKAVGARTPGETLAPLRAGFRPCVIIADPRRRGAAAWTVVDDLHADSVLANVPLVLVTSEAIDGQHESAHGIRERIAKPADPIEFLAAIDRQCRRDHALALAATPKERAGSDGISIVTL